MTLNYLDFRFIYINYVSPKFADLVEVSKKYYYWNFTIFTKAS